jgi:Protein of unknown function (DUF2878)
MNIWINALLYQLTWFAAVVGAAHGWWWAGPLMLVPFAAWQLGVGPARGVDGVLMTCAGMLGFALDSLLVQTGLISYAANWPEPRLAPIWIVALWLAFSLTLNHSLAILKSRLLLASALGAIAAPLAYGVAGAAWGAVSFPGSRVQALFALGLAWGLVTPALLVLARFLDRRQPIADFVPIPRTQR